MGCDIGFGELLRRGEIAACPGCSRRSRRIARRFTQASWPALMISTPVEVRPTIAEGASIASPVRAREVLAALRRSGGATVAVSEAEIEKALSQFSRIGLYVEPTSALPAPRSQSCWNEASFNPAETTVLVLTGAGLKTTRRIDELMGALPTR